MNLRLFAALLALALAIGNASAATCVLKIYVASPSDWSVPAPVSVAAPNNILVYTTVRDDLASPSAIVTDATVKISIDGGPATVAPWVPLAGQYQNSTKENTDGIHTITILATKPSVPCVGDTVTLYYQFKKNTLNAVPDFNPFLLPVLGACALLIVRKQG